MVRKTNPKPIATIETLAIPNTPRQLPHRVTCPLQNSIRVNDQWRICFAWTEENNASEVEIVDYH